VRSTGSFGFMTTINVFHNIKYRWLNCLKRLTPRSGQRIEFRWQDHF
jgi:hypothetical protein